MAQTADVDTPFELTFLSYSSAELLVEAELTSPMLDPTLHPTGSLRVKINTDPVTLKPKTKFLLNSFHVNSLTEFLRMQPLVRSTLEAELPRDCANWQKKKASPAEDAEILKRVKVAYLALRQCKMSSPIYLARVKEVQPAKYDEIVAAEDSPQTRTYFRLVLDCPWDTEHERHLSFRDGQFVALKVE